MTAFPPNLFGELAGSGAATKETVRSAIRSLYGVDFPERAVDEAAAFGIALWALGESAIGTEAVWMKGSSLG